MIHVSDSFYTFLHERRNKCRISRLIIRANNYAGYYPAYRLITTTDEIDFLTLRSDGTISYLPKGKELKYTDSGQWARDGRQNGRPATVIKKIFTKKARGLFSDKEYEDFVNGYKARSEAEKKHFVLRPNREIGNVYDMTREEGGGSLNDSCMNGDSDYLRIYEECPHLEILTLMGTCKYSGNEVLCGRALVWTTKIDGEDRKIMDRIYVTHDCYYDLFLEYAEKHKWWRKARFKSQENKVEFVLDGVSRELRVKIRTDTDFDRYPYIDTMTYGGDGWLSNDHNCGYSYEYTNTDGSRCGDDREYCEVSGEYYHADDMRYIERGRYNGYSIHMDYTVYCQTDNYYYYENDDSIVEIDGDYYRKDDEDVVEVDGEYHMAEDYRWSDFHEEYIHVDECVESEYHGDYIRKDEAYKAGDDYFHESVVNKCA